ncbi:MAG: Gldg family protein [Clostridia bacterium]|nr:Gldg family protein [Clostridia bacterium]
MDKNQMKKTAKKKLFSSKRFKYGAAATLFTTLFITAVILLNVIVSAIHAKYSLYFDLSAEQYFSISAASEEYVQRQFDSYKEAYGEEPQITISFLQARDRILDDKANHKPEVLGLVESYAEKFPQITVEFNEDILTHPQNYEEYTKLGYEINSNAILVKNTLTNTFRYLSFAQFLVYDTDEEENAWGFKGEIKLNSAIYYITSKNRPVVTFTDGHGETIPESLVETLEDCGFTIKRVNLSEEDLDPNTKILFMCSPQKDILTDESSEAAASEYTRISDYLNNFGSMVVVGSSTTPELPVLDEMLDAKGLKLVRNQMVLDDTFSHPQSNQLVFANYAPSSSVAAALTESLTKLDSPPRTVLPNSAHIELTKEGDGEITAIESVLTSSENSYVEITGKDGTEIKKGPFNLMAISTRWDYVDNVRHYGHVVLVGSERFFDETQFTAQYANSDITYNLIRLLSNEYIPEDDNIKPFQNTVLDIDKGEAITYGIISAAVIPLAIFTLGIVVFVKRKHK